LKINTFTKKIKTIEENFNKIMNFDVKRAEIYSNLINFFHKDINIFVEVIYLVQHLNDYLVSLHYFV